ncbi:MAG TPA: amidohydrolase [Solibacterales bacterium]|nr:amidohydrolase [Bryobacterales bacterium]
MHRWLLALFGGALLGADADLILHSGKVVTVDARFTVTEAVAVRGGRITRVGSSAEVLRLEKGPRTRLVDLQGKTLLPGLIDAHVHVLDAALSEYRQPLPPFDSIAAIQRWVRERAKTTPKGEWIVVPRTLPPRLAEMRMPTRQDLDVAPGHPVAFDGSYVWSANSAGLALSGIRRETPNPPGGEIVKDAQGEPNGILRNASHLLKGAQRAEAFTEDERLAAIEKMLRLYAAAGLTAVGDRAVLPPEISLYERLKKEKRLPVRVILTWRPDAAQPVERVVTEIRERPWTTNQGDERLKFGSFKVTLDGGQSVGTAYQRTPYGPFGRQLYGQTDPKARGTLFVEPEKLYRIFAAARDKGWQLTAHVQGGGAIDLLLDTFERLDREHSIAGMRHHVMHGSYMSEEAVKRMKRLGVAADAQPGWLYYDVPALSRVFGLENMRWFFPVRSWLQEGVVVAGGSDHMIGHDKNRAVNPFNPFLNMWMTMTRRTREGTVVYAEERIRREDALRMYTSGAAWLQFSENHRGSIEVGKLADLVVIDRDFLTCPEEEIKSIEPLLTLVEGEAVYTARDAKPRP